MEVDVIALKTFLETIRSSFALSLSIMSSVVDKSNIVVNLVKSQLYLKDAFDQFDELQSICLHITGCDLYVYFVLAAETKNHIFQVPFRTGFENNPLKILKI